MYVFNILALPEKFLGFCPALLGRMNVEKINHQRSPSRSKHVYDLSWGVMKYHAMILRVLFYLVLWNFIEGRHTCRSFCSGVL